MELRGAILRTFVLGGWLLAITCFGFANISCAQPVDDSDSNSPFAVSLDSGSICLSPMGMDE